ncbi:MAG: hypothetical protein P8016_16855 [Sedimentisphaerales bacterium]
MPDTHKIIISLLSIVIIAGLSISTPASAQQNSVTIDAAKTKEPINPYIYGQFIEHLGRSIYGGIWAEMLEDRKFYHPITAEYKPYVISRAIPAEAEFQVVGASPWQIIGSANSVTMVKENAFVGEHQGTPGKEKGKERDSARVQKRGKEIRVSLSRLFGLTIRMTRCSSKLYRRNM